MKRLLTIVFFAFSLNINAQSINFKVMSFESAIEQAKSEKKLVFLDFYATWCGPCKLMDKKTFSSANVANLMNEMFVNVKVDVDDKQFAKLMNDFNVNEVPTYIIIDLNQKVLNRLTGYFPEKKFIEELNSLKK
ncbi:MAG: thioredoxin fold domain-containing protein [Cytophagales bacterium]